MVYLLLAGGSFADLGYARCGLMTAGLTGLSLATPTGSALARPDAGSYGAAAGAVDLFRDPAAAVAADSVKKNVSWRGKLVCAIDGTTVCCLDTPANLRVSSRAGTITAAPA